MTFALRMYSTGSDGVNGSFDLLQYTVKSPSWWHLLIRAVSAFALIRKQI